MLEPRESDLPALFLVLVVLPLVTYILLGKWSEAAKKKERISLLSQLAAEEALRAEAMAAATVIPLTLVPSSNNEIHECAQCFGPATTRCSRCKSVRYCSGKCQIIHWREVHKQECQQLGTNSCCSSPKPASNEKSIYERHFLSDNMNSNCFGYNINRSMDEKTPSDDIIRHSLRTGASATAACATVDTPGVSVMERRSIDKRASRKSNREISKREDGAVLDSSDETSKTKATCSTSSYIFPSKEASIRHKLRNGDSMLLEEEIPKKHIVNIPGGSGNGQPTSRSTVPESHKLHSQYESICDSRTNFGTLSSLYSAKNGTDVCDIEMDLLSDRQNKLKEGITSNDETAELNCASDMTSMKRSIKTKSASHSPRTKMYKSLKSIMKASREQSCSEMEMKGQIADESKVAKIRDTIPTQGSNGVANMGILKMIGLRKPSKLDRQEISEISDRHKKLKMLFPYGEFVKFFQCEVFDLSPRGLVNCGNSCYANAVLQCLTCTKPLTIYLLRRSHSKACTVKDWCLMCELEQHVMMLRESGGPLSPSRILLHMRSINCQIGDGSQEDAHEFLRLLVTSMQSICLEGLGGEDMVDPRLQETTFIQHTFGGRLRSKVKCLRCHHESERYENIMDLTLEIFGWVESLEDALTQFTTPEDLDGDNMYRCGRCAAYVRARKQLRIHEAPNILTIVLKRFQEGSYGKINKCITFPDMLDMIPFMTGTDDIPPLYMLYAVVVHLDTLNASFSGHYVSYVKDMHDNWLRIDDTEVQPVPMSHVMSEGAYMLFYMRSCPRPTRAYYTGKAAWNQAPGFAKHWTSKSQKSSRSSQSKSSCQFVGPEPSSGLRPEMAMLFTDHTSNGIFRSANRNRPQMETCAESVSMDFSDATSSDWSIFTSSDEASFTTESTRDSVSTVDYTDTCNIDPISSIFNPMYAAKYPSHKTVSCSRFSSSKPQTRFVSEGTGLGLVSDSCLLTQPLDSVRWNGENLKQVSAPSIQALPSNSNCAACIKYESKPKDDLHRTSGHCKTWFRTD